MGHRVQGGERKGWNSNEFHSLTVAQHPGIWGICLSCLVQIARWPRLPVPGGGWTGWLSSVPFRPVAFSPWDTC